MAFGVFIHRASSIYDDIPERQYQFPRQYLGRVSQCVGDWIVYYEPTKTEQARGYFATAKVERVVPDPRLEGMYLALMEPGSYLDFAVSVPFAEGGLYVEQGLLNEAGKLSGRAQSAVRPLSASDFRRIVSRGLLEHESLLPRVDLPEISNTVYGEIGERAQDPFVFEVDRERELSTVNRTLRDRVFRRVVLRAYDERCAVSGIKLINGGGRAEVAAAHIRPVSHGGPDALHNGLALSGTAHWMFDRGLISIGDDHAILISRHVNDIDSVNALVHRSGRLVGPISERDAPHPAFLSWHRENVFKA